MYNIVDNSRQKIFDEYTGLSLTGNGGTELLYRKLKEKLDPELFDKFQIICSRVNKFNGKPAIFYLHDCWDDPEAQRLSNPEFRKQFKKLVFVSDWQFQTYNQGLGVPYSESIILKNAIDPIDVKDDDKPKDRINLIYTSTPNRGLELLIPTFIHLSNMFDNIYLDVFSSFDIYGWPQRNVPYQHLFETCKNHPKITYHGFQPNDVVREALKKSHIFAYPCIHKETSCLAAIEAMSAKNVIVCPNYGALTETVNNIGYVYHWDESPNVHVNRFAEVLIMAIKNIENSTNMVNTAKHRVDQLYNWQYRIKEWELLLSNLIDKN